MIVTILGLLLHATQTFGSFWFLAKIAGNPSPAAIILDLTGFILPSYLLLIVSSFRSAPLIPKNLLEFEPACIQTFRMQQMQGQTTSGYTQF